MDINLNVLVINLKSSSERRARMSKQLNSLGIPYEFIEATEGSMLTDLWIENNVGDRLKDIYYNKLHFSVNKNSLACADSHRRAQVIASNFDNGYTLILEDDVELANNFRKKIMNVIKFMQEYTLHICFPGYNSPKGKFENSRSLGNSGLSFFEYSTNGNVSGAYSYVVDSVGARKLVEDNLEKIQDMADAFGIIEKGLNKCTVVLYPKIVTTGYLESDMDYLIFRNNLLQNSKKIIYSLSLKSSIIRYFLRHIKERRW